MADIGQAYRTFAEQKARGVSPRYEEFALGVAGDADLLGFLSTLPESKRQPNLLFAAVKYLTGALPDFEAFRRYVTEHQGRLRDVLLRRSTQTNEPGRCAVLVPLLASLPQPIALLEAGAAAGLCLLCDRYAYDYGGRRVGPGNASVVFRCEVPGPVPVPDQLPQVSWRRGVDLHPLNVMDADTAAWLSALVWADNDDREVRLRSALNIAEKDSPLVVAGDVVDSLDRLAARAPTGVTLVVLISALMPYLRQDERPRFVELVSSLRCIWVSFEAQAGSRASRAGSGGRCRSRRSGVPTRQASARRPRADHPSGPSS